MKRSPKERLGLTAAGLFCAAPLIVGIIRDWTTGYDHRMVWMAGMATLFPVGVLLTAFGRRRARRAVTVQAISILLVSTLLSVGTGLLLGATATQGLWAVSAAFGISLSIASLLVAWSRPAS